MTALSGTVWVLQLAVAGLAAAGIARAPVRAEGAACAARADACAIVDTTADEDVRDGVLSLREGLLLQGGGMALSDLTAAEAARVHVVTPLGLRGSVHLNFEPGVFCAACEAVITLAPPGLGEPDDVSLPPGLGEPDSTPPGQTHPDQIGMAVIDGVEVPAHVTIDGSRLAAHQAGLRLIGKGQVHGMHFRNFAGRAIEIEEKVAKGILIGSDLDGVNDAAEAVTFANNGADIVYLR